MPLTGAGDLAAEFLAAFDVVPVVAVDHPLAREPAPIARATLEPHVQLVLTDRTPLTQNFSGGIVGHHIWRFADLSTRLEFLLAGSAGATCLCIWSRTYRRRTTEGAPARRAGPVPVPRPCDAMRGREIGRAGRWLIGDLRRLLTVCPEAYRAAEAAA